MDRVGEGTVTERLCDRGIEVSANLGPWNQDQSLEAMKQCADLILRIAIGGMNRTLRVFPYDDVEVCGWTVPKGVSSVESKTRNADNTDHPSLDPNLNVHILDAQRSRRLPRPKRFRTHSLDRRQSRASEGHASVLCSFRQGQHELRRTEVSLSS